MGLYRIEIPTGTSTGKELSTSEKIDLEKSFPAISDEAAYKRVENFIRVGCLLFKEIKPPFKKE